MKAKALVYARVSTDEQAKHGQSIETQIALCKTYLNTSNITLEQAYIDEGRSGTDFNRPALQEMLLRLHDGDISILVVQDTDRLARDTHDYLKIRALFRKNNVQLVSLNQPNINDSPEGMLLDEILASINAFQPRVTGRKAKETMLEKAKQGIYPSYAPFGYRNTENPMPTGKFDKRILTPHEEEAYFIKRIFELYSSGIYTLSTLVTTLIKEGMRTRSNRPIYESFLHNILSNSLYCGRFEWGGLIINCAKHKALVNDDLFQQCKLILSMHNKYASRKRIHDFLLNGYIFCSKCSSQIWAEEHKKREKTYPYYFCKKCKVYGNQHNIENAVCELFGSFQFSDEYINKVLQLAKEQLEVIRNEAGLRELHVVAKKTELETKMIRLENALVEGTVTGEVFKKLYGNLEQELSLMHIQLTKGSSYYAKKIKTLEEFLNLARNIKKSYQDAPKDLKRQYIRIFFSKIYVCKEDIVDVKLSEQLQPLVEKDSVRVQASWLPIQNFIRSLIPIFAN